MKIRPRRLRGNKQILDLVAETRLSVSDLVYPIFIHDQKAKKISINSLPGIYKWDIESVKAHLEECIAKKIFNIAIFPSISSELKDAFATEALNPNGLVPSFLKKYTQLFPQLNFIVDIALDPYSSDGHDGLVCPQTKKILNDKTIEVLANMSVVLAKSGAHFVAPSDMMDGRVTKIRQALDQEGIIDCGIIAYTAKYCSNYYGPFREALDSSPGFGDKSSYQMDFRNSKTAIRELKLDISEGADIVMVKPALAYLDIIKEFKNQSTVPVSAYNVSGEYAMIKNAIAAGLVSEEIILENLIAIKRAGADIIFTYHALEVADNL